MDREKTIYTFLDIVRTKRSLLIPDTISKYKKDIILRKTINILGELDYMIFLVTKYAKYDYVLNSKEYLKGLKGGNGDLKGQFGLIGYNFIGGLCEHDVIIVYEANYNDIEPLLNLHKGINSVIGFAYY